MHQIQHRSGLYCFEMCLNEVCIRSVFEQKIGPYKVCIFVNMGPFEKLAALHALCPCNAKNKNHGHPLIDPQLYCFVF